jgi:hypothetical protein
MPVNSSKAHWEAQKGGPLNVIYTAPTPAGRTRLRAQAAALGHDDLTPFRHIGFGRDTDDEPGSSSLFLSAAYCRRCEVAVCEAYNYKRCRYTAPPSLTSPCSGLAGQKRSTI